MLVVFVFLGRELNPFDPHLFSGHDNTQGARIQEFALNISSGIIPPRLAPHFSFQHGYPVFNFYAPFAYWVGSLIHIAGVSTAISLKLLLLLGLLISFISFFLFASLFFGFWGGLLGGSIYTSSLWMAVEIFVRGNIGELWFMAVFPLGLYFLKINDKESKGYLFVISSLVLSFLFTVHNVLSLISVLFLVLFSLLLIHRKKALLTIVIGLLLASYFLVPALLENKLTYANEIAKKTKYSDHFLCIQQLWKADKWSYGGSGVGCMSDDMSFQIGKAQLVVAGVGFMIFLSSLKKKKKNSIPIFILCWTILSVLLTLELSKPIWDLFSPLMAIFQFPWRFLSFVVFGVAFFSSYLIYISTNKKIQIVCIVILSMGTFMMSSKFFSKPWKYTTDEYTSMFLTDKYIGRKAAYEIPEYFPRTGDYKTWRTYDELEVGFYNNKISYKVNTPFYKEIKIDQNQITLPIHYFPFWEIVIDGVKYIPQSFDALGRPILSELSSHSTIILRYNETPIERAGNLITLITFITVMPVCLSKKIWKKMSIILQ